MFAPWRSIPAAAPLERKRKRRCPSSATAKRPFPELAGPSGGVIQKTDRRLSSPRAIEESGDLVAAGRGSVRPTDLSEGGERSKPVQWANRLIGLALAGLGGKRMWAQARHLVAQRRSERAGAGTLMVIRRVTRGWRTLRAASTALLPQGHPPRRPRGTFSDFLGSLATFRWFGRAAWSCREWVMPLRGIRTPTLGSGVVFPCRDEGEAGDSAMGAAGGDAVICVGPHAEKREGSDRDWLEKCVRQTPEMTAEDWENGAESCDRGRLGDA
jgi:hypothetical protein